MNVSLTQSAVAYTINHLMRVAAPSLLYTFEPASDDLSAPGVLCAGGQTIHFNLIPRDRWPALLDGTYLMHHLPSFDGKEDVPVLLSESCPFAQWLGNDLIINSDIVTLSFLLLSRAEEILLPQRDQYGRFLHEYSLAKQYGFIDIPLVDEWAMLLRKALLERLSSVALGENCPSLRPTHDMDSARRFPDFLMAARTILGGDLMLRKSPKLAWESLTQYAACRNRPERDPELLGAEELLAASRRHGLRSEFYFMGLAEGEADYRYDVTAPAVKAFARKAEDGGMVCGFHGSRLTPQDPERFSLERDRVAETLGTPPICGRQHYLCFDALKTPSVWEKSKFEYDTTLGYADREGFRCGTCFAYPLYDLEHDCPLRVLERPLAVMDGTLREYRGLSPEEALTSMKRLFDRSFAVGGDFVILWHNGCVFRDWSEWFREVYVPFIDWAMARLGKDEKN